MNAHLQLILKEIPTRMSGSFLQILFLSFKLCGQERDVLPARSVDCLLIIDGLLVVCQWPFILKTWSFIAVNFTRNGVRVGSGRFVANCKERGSR